MGSRDLRQRIDRVREFNRMYTRIVGALDEGLLDSPYSLTEARVLFELAQRDSVDVAELRRTLDLDGGYLSRLLARFDADGLVHRGKSTSDGRRQVVRLTPAGWRAFRKLDKASAAEVAELLSTVDDDGQRRLIEAMDVITARLGGRETPRTVVLRPLRAGDLGWVVQRHGELYAHEYGLDRGYEALIARIVSDYVDGHDADRESAWIAELDGEPAGSIFCVRKDDTTAKLRLLLVEPSVRGHGVGSRLVEQCLAFARDSGYTAIELWTIDVLAAARRIYERAGFTMVDEQPEKLFGTKVVGQTWRLDL
ncbi:MarR family transcriptional regulator with acetyltransferase activity [Herbihabitans rhizosphaerae]|uniref:MarR family transcriptional regulator with acetyltransferase activity n=1 Tax=Herbihabitans rhizosphaerae TaxID=1872711 RepID=A0A4Q7KMJ1_9PSEU|nr:helix-turn-helix domain-containing GNAT family N-acetyltransferase [Herbihabitans rhizosphaerae]RZS37765.1 MarR family transcriptional regulator with acetyltransferase activity [Herbihabitans rhizosphaerae]